MLISYRAINGPATRHWFRGSQVGVIIAARIKATIINGFRLLASHCDVITPNLASKVVITGISKIRPIDRSSLVAIEI